MPVNLFCLEVSKGRGVFSLFSLFKIYLLVFDLLALCPLNTPVLNPTCLRTPGVPSVVLLLFDCVVVIDKAHWGTQCSLFCLFLLSSCSAQIALLACLCVVTVPRGTLGYSRQHEQ